MVFRILVIVCLCLLVACQRGENEPDDPEKNVLEAKKHMGENRLKEAIELLEKCINTCDNTSEVTELLATAYLRKGDGELAAHYFEWTASLSELKYYCYLKAAEIYENLKDFGRAVLCYRFYLEALPEDEEIQVRYGNALARDGQKKKALGILVSHEKDDAAVHNQIAELFFSLGNYTQARNWYLSALRCERNNRVALDGLWTIGLLFRDWEMLWEVGTTLRDLGVKFMDGISLAHLMEILKARQRALAALRAADFHFDKVVLPMFSSEQMASEPSPAAKGISPPPQAAKGEKMNDWRAEVRKAMGRGDFEGAVAALWKTLGADGKNVDAWIDLTDCLLKINKYDIAEMAIQEAIKFSPKRVDLHLTYLDIILRTHSSADYIRILREEKRKFPADAEMRLLWARAQEIYREDAAGAKRSYEKFLQLAPPGHPEISKIRHLLEAYNSKP